jgi:exosortase
MAEKWQSDPQYSHGYLVPIFAIGLAYWRRKGLDWANCTFDGRGLILLAIGGAAYVAGGYFYLDFLSSAALLPAVMGCLLLVGGMKTLRWGLPMAAFLVFMVPLPYAFETALGRPLQKLATQASTWMLQTLGFPAVSEGNIILLEHGSISVVEACSGLSMLLTFGAMATGVAIVVSRPMLDRILVVLSAVPVALAVNVARITSNGIAIEYWGPEVAHKWFHDQGGWLMMPLALALLGLELWMLNRLLVAPPAEAGLPLLDIPVPQTRKTVSTAVSR